MWPGLALPHSEQVWKFGACQRFAARRMRFFDFEVLRFGTAMGLNLDLQVSDLVMPQSR